MRRWSVWLLLGACWCLACAEDRHPDPPTSSSSAGSAAQLPIGGSSVGGSAPILVPSGPGPSPLGESTIDLGAECDPTRGVASDSEALLVQDPKILARFGLERVLSSIIQSVEAQTPPLEALQWLFDTQNSSALGVFPSNVHCDDLLNPAFGSVPATDCPRAEAALAQSPSLLLPDDPDGFVPIALVNRFDALASDLSTCGRYDIVYAKRSGATDPTKRVLLSFQATLPNPTSRLAGCRSVAELWAGLGESDDSGSRADALEAFFFEGLADYGPVVHALNYGLGTRDCDGPCGQVQVGQGLQEPFQFRQFRPERSVSDDGARLSFVPTRLPGVLRNELFDPALPDPYGPGFRSQLTGSVYNLSTWEVPRLRFGGGSIYSQGESSVSGPGAPSYLATMATSERGYELRAALESMIQPQDADGCPDDDPLNADALVQRVAGLSCAGCHAPDLTIEAERSIGCGQAWPRSLGVTHIDEQGELSEALRNVFLPYRAELLTLYLQACAGTAVATALGVVEPPLLLPNP